MLAPAGALAGAGHTERPLRVHQVRSGTCSLRLLELPPAHRTHFAQSMSSSWPILLRESPHLENSPMLITALSVPLTLDPMNRVRVTKVTVKSHLSGVTIANCRGV